MPKRCASSLTVACCSYSLINSVTSVMLWRPSRRYASQPRYADEDGVVATLCIWVGRRGTVRLPNGTTWLLKRVSQRHIHTHYLVR
jgi:hypothetical protein